MAQPDSSAIRFSQRNSCNTAYVETYVSGTNFIIGTDSTGSIRGFTSINLSGSITSASFSVSSSYATSASYAPSQLITGETYPITSSWATSSISSSYALTSSAVTITDTPTTSSTYYVTFVDGTTGTRAIRTDSSLLTWNPNTNTLSSSGNLYVAGGKVDSDFVSAQLFPSAETIVIGGVPTVTILGGDLKLNSGKILTVNANTGLTILDSGITIFGNAISSSLGTASIKLGTNGDVTASRNLNVVGVSTLGTVSASIFVGSHTGSLFGTSSWSTNSLTASYVSSSNIVGTVTSASYALSSSFSPTTITASWATNALTASSLVVGNSYNITNLTASNISASGTGSFGIVGIGTTSPGALLTVGSTTTTTSSMTLQGEYQSSVFNNTNIFNFRHGGYDRWRFGTNQNSAASNDFDFRINAINADVNGYNTFVTIKGLTGNVGIGTTSPAYLLDVSGSSRHGYRSSDTHQFTGSVSISGSLNATSSWATNSLTSSYVSSSNIVGTVTSASYSLSASYASNVISNAITSPNSQTNITTNNNGISASVSGTQILTVITQSSITSQNGSSSFQLNGRLSASNVNVGVPNDSYPWGTSLIGSYFSTWNTDTNVSDILRFFAGAFSSSYPTPAPNTKTFASITTTSTLGSTVTINGRVPTGSTNVNINYLQPLGWSTVGSTVFSGFTFRGGTNYLSYGSTTGGSTTVSSSLGSSAFGLGSLTNGNVTAIHLSGSFTITFASSSAGTINYTNTASVLLTQASINTVTPTVASPISLNSIPSANTAVIPSVYQDGYFNNFTGSNLTNSISLSSVSSSGIYGFTGSVGLNSGSSPYTFYTGTNTTVYYTPLTDASFSTNTITSPNSTITASTAVSRSLSGAPYLTSGSTYRYTVTGSGAFNPLYVNGTVSTVTIPTNNLGLTTANSTTLTTNPTIQTTGVVKSSDYITTRAVGSYPYESDVIVFDVTMGAAGTTNTVAQSGSSISTFTLTNTTYNRAGSGTTIGSQTVNIHTAGSFGQPSSSGSLLYYGRPNGYTTASLTFGSQSLNPGAITEQFLDEAYRLTLANNILSWSGSYVNSSSYLPTSSLQVKPGYLVDPGGTYRYWYPSGYGTTYKYYVRHFQSSVVINKLQITVAGNTSLVGWDSTSAGMAIALIFESGNSNVYSNCRLYDVSNTGQNLITSNITTSDLTTVGTNPFSSSIDLYGNNGTGASVSSGVIIFPMRTADGAVLDNTNASKDEVYVLVRYKGSTTPLTSIKIEKLS